MKTLIIKPKNKGQLKDLKAVLSYLKVDFKTEKGVERAYTAGFTAKMKRSEEDIKAGRTTAIKPADI